MPPAVLLATVNLNLKGMKNEGYDVDRDPGNGNDGSSNS